MTDMTQEIRITATIIIPLVLQLTGLLFAVSVDPYIYRKQRRVMIIIVLVIASLVAQNILDETLRDNSGEWITWTLVSIYGYSIRPVILVFFFYIIDRERKHRLLWIVAAVNAAVYFTALFSGLAFRISDDGHFVRGPLGYTCHIVSFVLLAGLLWLSVRKERINKRAAGFIPVFNVVLIVASVLADSLAYISGFPVSYLTMTAISCTLFYYIWLHLKFVEEHEQALMAEQRIRLMMTQIQPHFLYNTLSTIRTLCDTDPAVAGDVVEKFASYLRQNLDSLSIDGLIPFGKELEHTRIYTDIEKIRFPRIQLEYDIEDDGFSVPALTLQPIVENAIRHGVRIREHGEITVSTTKKDSYHEILVKDNGKGFDTAALNEDDEGHVGIRSVRERVGKMCGGTVTIDSRIGEGTTVAIRIPFERQEK